MERFVSDFPKRKSNQAYIEVAHYYFDQGVKALQWFQK
jgi:hypothetical protein